MSFPARAARDWHLKTRVLPLGPRTLLMGILNVTPDSFSDGGAYTSAKPTTGEAEGRAGKAVDRALAMLAEGADILDIGGESTRPGATAVRPAEEQSRILPVIQAILQVRPGAILSVDTYHAETARLAIKAGVEIINDVSGLIWDPAMAGVLATGQAGAVLMHARGTPGQWATLPALAAEDVLPTVLQGLEASLALAHSAGVDRRRIVVDPGFGFGKRGQENFVLHAGLTQLGGLDQPVLVGTSRKGFLGHRESSAEARLGASMASNVAAALAGASVIRTHDVEAARAACDVADSILAASALG